MLPQSFYASKWLFYASDGRRELRKQLLDISYSDVNCSHQKSCLCDLSVTIHVSPPKFQKFVRGDPPRSQSEINLMVLQWIESDFIVAAGTLLPRTVPDITSSLRMKVAFSSNMREIPAPFYYKSTYTAGRLPSIDTRVLIASKMADYETMGSQGVDIDPEILQKHVFLPTKRFPNPDFVPDTTVPSLLILAARKVVEFNRAFGETNGRPHVVHSLEGIDTSTKLQDTISLKDMPVKDITPDQRQILTKLERALDLHHSLLGVDKYIGKVPAEINPLALQGTPLHSSNGCHEGETIVHVVDGYRYVYNPKGQKFEHYRATIREMFEHFRTRAPPLITWEISPKHELKYSTEKQLNDEDHRKWTRKHRIFEIPRSIYIYKERVILFVHKILVNNTRVKIGHRWPRGGADFLFQGLKIDGKFGDGDFDKFDQSIHSFFTNLFYSMLTVFYGEGPDKDLLQWISSQLAENCVSRISHLYEDVWAEVLGGLPSGAFATSNCGSWILHLLYCLFLICVMDDLRDQKNRVMLRKMETYLAESSIWIIVYGDDHVIHSPPDFNDLVGELAFSKWCGRFWNMKIRDLRNDVPLLSVVRNGEIQKKGLVFLKNYFVRCELDIPNPPSMLPFRAKSEVCWKAVWGRTGGERTIADVLLSAKGIAYTMMGVNSYAHEWLRVFHDSLKLMMTEDEFDLVNLCRVDFRKLRMYGLNEQTIKADFPSLKYLQLRNSVDVAYHTHSRNPNPKEFKPFGEDDE